VQTNGQTGATTGLEFYVYAWDGNSVYSDNASGTDASFTVANRKGSPLIDMVTMNVTTAVAARLRRGVAACFNGLMPQKWGLIAINNSGGALSTTAGDHIISYQGINYTVI
jgi:hypothetical protein